MQNSLSSLFNGCQAKLLPYSCPGRRPSVKPKVLTDRALKALRPASPGKRDIHWDALVPSFGVRVTDTGAASYIVMRRLGRGGPLLRRSIGLPWVAPCPPPTPLAEARDKARRVVEALMSGIDPKVEEAEQKRIQQHGKARTFAATFKVYAEDHLAQLRTGHSVWRTVKKHVRPVWGGRPLTEIRRTDVNELVRGLRKTIPVGVNRLLANLKTFFSWAVDQEIIEFSPAQAVKRPTREMKRDRALSDVEIRAIWRACEKLGLYGSAFRLMLTTGQRRTECGSIAWTEIDEANATWRLGPDRTKSARAHEIPLSNLALSIVSSQRRIEGQRYVFVAGRGAPLSGWSRAKRKLDAFALIELQNELGESAELAEWHIHDLRRSCATGMARLGVDRIVIAKILNHADREVTAIYDRHRYDEEKRRALQLWAERLLIIVKPAGGNVLSLPIRA